MFVEKSARQKHNQKAEKQFGVSLPPRTFVSTLPIAVPFRIPKQTLPFFCALKQEGSDESEYSRLAAR
jgi:hypothetical protein